MRKRTAKGLIWEWVRDAQQAMRAYSAQRDTGQLFHALRRVEQIAGAVQLERHMERSLPRLLLLEYQGLSAEVSLEASKMFGIPLGT